MIALSKGKVKLVEGKREREALASCYCPFFWTLLFLQDQSQQD